MKPNNLKTAAKLQKIKAWIINHKIAMVAFSLFIIATVTLLTPKILYVSFSPFIKKDVSFLLTELKSGTAIEGADVLFNGSMYKSDSTGLVNIGSVSVGVKSIEVFKPFYEPLKTSLVVGLLGQPKQQSYKLPAKGEVVRVTVNNRITGRPIAEALVRAKKGGQGLTNNSGVAVLVLPSGSKTSEVAVTGSTILDTTSTVYDANDSTTNIVHTVPKGRVYSLQKNNGLLDTISTNLDGSDAKVILAGSGYEDFNDTQLIISANTKYAALKTRRDNNIYAKLYVYDSTDESFLVVQEESASIIPVGWVGTKFIYLINRRTMQPWQPARQSLYSYDAANKKTNLIDQTGAEGPGVLDYAGESFESVYLLYRKVVYTKKWQASYYYGARLADKRMSVTSALPDGSQKNVVKQWQAGYNATIKTAQSGPSKLNIYVELDGVKISHYTYTDEKITDYTSEVDVKFVDKNQYPIYHASPNDASSVWTQKHKNIEIATYLGNKNGEGVRTIVADPEYTALGWYTEDYILLRSRSNKLLVVSRKGTGFGLVPLKVGDYFLPSLDYRAYGYGY